HNSTANIVGIVVPRDLIRSQDNRRVRDYAKSAWFITKNTKAVQILKQFRNNRQKVAIVLDEKGLAVGILTLDDILEEVFGKSKITREKGVKGKKVLLIERTFPGDMKIADFNAQFSTNLDSHGAETLAELLIQTLGHHPEKGDSIYIE